MYKCHVRIYQAVAEGGWNFNSQFTLPGAELAVFGSIVRQLLGDAQQRIVFRAQVSRRGSFATCIYCTVRYKVHI